MNTHSPQNTPTQDGEISLFSVALTLAANLRLLTIGPIVAGLIAFGVSSMLPEKFESIAILDVSDRRDVVAILATSPRVLDPVAERLAKTKGVVQDKVREGLLGRLSITVGRNNSLLTLTAKGKSAEEANALATEVLEQLFVAAVPNGQDAKDLEQSLALARTMYANNQTVIATASELFGVAKREKDISGGLQGYAALIALQQSLAIQITNDERSLRGLTESSLIQHPTLASEPAARNRFSISVLTAFVTEFGLLLFVFIRNALANAAKLEGSERVKRLRSLLLGSIGIR